MSKQNKCKACGKIINPMKNLCSDCIKKNDAVNFKKFREFLTANPGADINTIVKRTGLNQKKVLEYIERKSLDIKV